ncbi:MAG: hypothetical protein JNM19_11800 [Chitinophagaceae bacterium]|nr:hypothetical protein [Chitinophagaceae bacterium]
MKIHPPIKRGMYFIIGNSSFLYLLSTIHFFRSSSIQSFYMHINILSQPVNIKPVICRLCIGNS